jgi:hypothetical protein
MLCVPNTVTLLRYNVPEMYASFVTLNPPSVYNDAVVVKPVGLNDEEKYCPPTKVLLPVVA